MENQTNLNPVPKNFNKNLIIIAMGFLAVILFAFSYLLWQQTLLTTKLKSEIKSQEEKISQLLAESPEPTQADDSNTIQTQDNRILLTMDNIKKYWTPETGCDEKFNYDNPSTLVTYTSKDSDLSVNLPYNPNWGNENYRINPYDKTEDGIQFGNIGQIGTCHWTRYGKIDFLAPMTATQVLVDLENKGMDEIKKVTLDNGLTAYQYIVGINDPLPVPKITVIGRLYNYEISNGPSTLSSQETEIFAGIIEIANSIKLLD